MAVIMNGMKGGKARVATVAVSDFCRPFIMPTRKHTQSQTQITIYDARNHICTRSRRQHWICICTAEPSFHWPSSATKLE